MKRENRHIHVCFTAVVLMMAAVLASGCASGKGSMAPEVKYANPFHDHVSELTGNSAIDREDEELPEMTADEYEIRGDIALKQKKFPSAYIQYRKALALSPDEIRLEYKIGLTCLLGGKLDAAMVQFRKVAEVSSDNANLFENMGRVYFLKRDYPQAKKHFEKALALDDRLWECHSFLGYIYDLRGNPEKATGHYLAALIRSPQENRPEKGRIYNNLGVSYVLCGRFSEAIVAFRAALNHQYTHQKVYNNLGAALAHTGQYAEAFEVFKKMENAPLAYNNLGSFHLKAGNYDDAIRCFERAIELNPRFDPRFNENMALAKMEKQKAEGAVSNK